MEHESECKALLVHSFTELDLHLSDIQMAQFMCYLSQLMLWNKTTNLTSITDPQEIVIKHFVDSITALAATTFPPRARLADVGTGGGFPGVPLKIIRNDLQLLLIEPNRKKCSFLASIIGLLRLQDVDIFTGTLQQYCEHDRPEADIATVRAVRFEEISDDLTKLVLPTGRIVLYRTKSLHPSELKGGFKIESQQPFCLPGHSGKRVISVLSQSPKQ